MSWDPFSDEDDEDRRPRATGEARGARVWRGTRSALGWTGVVASIVALALGAVYAVNVAGLGATIRPAERMISAFSAAVSPNAEMIAPACPMRRPFGAVIPAT